MPQSDDNEYPTQDLRLIRLHTCWRAFNRTTVNENHLLMENVAAVRAMRFPEDLPVLLFVSEMTAAYVRDSKWPKG